jgi:tetratricopeptide (TPR) repeat protein/c-di-GMP-binding flagellar brake protein YcgR
MSDVYLWDTYEKVGREAMERRDYAQAIEAFRSAVGVAEQLGGEELRLVMSLRHLSQATSKAGQLSLAYDLLGRTEEIAVTRLGETHSETVQIKRDLYDLSRQLGHLDRAEGYLVEVLGVVRAHGETEEFLEILELLAQLAGERERMDHAAQLYQEIVEARSTLYGADHPSVAQALLWLSTALSRNGQGEAAEAPLTQAFSLLEQQFADDPKNLAQSLLAGAELMISGGRPAAALEHQKRALDILSSVVEDGHESLWDTREMIASTLASLGRLEESVELLEFCLQHRNARDHRTAALVKNLAGLYLSLRKIERAEVLYREATELLHQTLGPEHPASLATLEERIQLYHFNGRPQEALELALTTIRPTEQRYGPGHPNTAQVYASTAVLAHAARRWDTAYELMKAAEAIWETLVPRPTDVLSNCRLNMATCLVELGRHAEAAMALNQVNVASGSPLEPVVRDLWARIEAGSAAPATEAAPATAPQVPAPDTGESGKRRSIKLSLGGAFAGPRKREPETAPEPPSQPQPEPESYLPPAVGRPIWAPKEEEPQPEPVDAVADSAPAAGELEEVNPFDDITFTEVDPRLELVELQSQVSQWPLEQPAPVAGDPWHAAQTTDAPAQQATPGDEVPRQAVVSTPPAETAGVTGAAEVVEKALHETSLETIRESVRDSAHPVSEAVLWDDLPRAGNQDTAPPAQPAFPQAELLELPQLPGQEPELPGQEPEFRAELEFTGEEMAAKEPPTQESAPPAEQPEVTAEEPPTEEPERPGQPLGVSDPAAKAAEMAEMAEATNPVVATGLPVVSEGVAAATPVPDSATPDTELTAQDLSAAELPPYLPEIAPDLPSEELVAEDVREWVPGDTDERREHRRFNLGMNRFFDLSLINAKGELLVVRSFLVDLSAGGLRINTEQPLPMRETFQLTLPSELLRQELQLSARVTWQRALFGATYIQGVEFLDVTERQRAVLEAALGGDLSESGRQHYRLYRPFPIQIAPSEEADWIHSYASDLSVEGVGTRLEDEISAGQQIRLRLGLEFELPAVEVAATVAWSRPGSNGVSHGLRFEEVGPVEARTIRLYIDRCLELSPD